MIPEAYRKEYFKASGIYQFRNKLNNKVYIGSTVHLGVRKCVHIRNLKLNTHCNIRFQNAWNKYGKENFIFEVLELCSKENLLAREQYYIDSNKSFGKNGYNVLSKTNNSLGYKHTEESKEKMKKVHTGKKLSEEHKKNIGLSNLGKTITEETRERLRLAHTEFLRQKAKEKSIPVCQYTLDDKLLQCFNSKNEAERITGIAVEAINRSLNNKCKQRIKFKWKLKI